MEDYISASELGEYLYCQRAWWLRRRGAKAVEQDRLEQGTQQHEELAEVAQAVEAGSRAGRRLLWLGVALMFFLLLVKLLAG